MNNEELKTVGKTDVRYFLANLDNRNMLWDTKEGIFAVTPEYEQKFCDMFKWNDRSYFGSNGRWRAIYKLKGISRRGIRFY